MPTYMLNLQFTQDDLSRFLASGSNVVVAKPSNGAAPNVAWVVFRPFIKNSMTWDDDYGIYASNTELTSGGARLDQISQTGYPAVPAKTYELGPGGFFGPPRGNAQQGTYSALNLYNNLPKGHLTFGLYQNAEINGTLQEGNAVSAAVVLYNSTAVITPFTTVYLWIQSQVVSNSVITTVTSPQTSVRFGGNVTEVSLAYDPDSGKFNAPPRTELAEGITIEHHEPIL